MKITEKPHYVCFSFLYSSGPIIGSHLFERLGNGKRTSPQNQISMLGCKRWIAADWFTNFLIKWQSFLIKYII